MPFAVTHILVPIVIVDLIRHHILEKEHIQKHSFSTWYVLIAGLAGLLPDLDFVAQWAYNYIFGTNIYIHRTFTHTIYPVIVVFVFAVLFYEWDFKLFGFTNKQYSLFFLMLFAGFFAHVLLDCSITGEIDFLYPFGETSFCRGLIREDISGVKLAGLDAILLVIWLIYEEQRHKIRDFL